MFTLLFLIYFKANTDDIYHTPLEFNGEQKVRDTKREMSEIAESKKDPRKDLTGSAAPGRKKPFWIGIKFPRRYILYGLNNCVSFTYFSLGNIC